MFRAYCRRISAHCFVFLLGLILCGGAVVCTVFAQTQPRNPDAGELFKHGQQELQQGRLDAAERDFRAVLSVDPQAASAYANLGVIQMRRKQWASALQMLHQAEHLAPQLAGIRLNIGLVYYRQNDFQAAISPFTSVVRDVPESGQARYLLGLCDFFTEHYTDSAGVLEPLWSQQSNNLNYLYVLGIAANKAGLSKLEDRALGRLVEIGQDSDEFHLLMGKALLNRSEYDRAIQQLKRVTDAGSKLPFVHFNLGLAYIEQNDLEKAKAEFLSEMSIEPDLADNYTELGLVAYQQQQYEEAEARFRKALTLNPHDANAHFYLAKVLQHQNKFTAALQELDKALRLSPQSQNIHYVRGQVLLKLGRSSEAKAEMATTNRISSEEISKSRKGRENMPLPNPELRHEPQ
jgi:tetratricopeptide (TPR) repeat protein